MQRLEFRAMGCQMLAIVDSASGQATQALAQVPTAFAVWEQALSRFREDSELSRLNRSAGRRVTVSTILWEVVQAALRAAHDSDGLAVPTLLDALEAAGYDRTFEALGPSARQIAPTQTADWRTIECDPRTRSIYLPAGTRLDLGGIVKGWGAERAARALSAYGPALVDAGGDIAVSGAMADGQSWPVAIASPLGIESEAENLLLIINAGGVATSGRDYRRWLQAGRWQHHILDPRSGRPAETDVLSATVIAPTAVEAEVAAKASLILGSRDGLAWLEARPTLAGLLILEDGRALHSRRLRDCLWRP
jgi:thiamine biosynthesis lipoprotein